jgi:predicted membrane-bound mannosyltransferase
MVHRLFAPIVLAGIALGGCQREGRGVSPAADAARPRDAAAVRAGSAATRDAAADVVAARRRDAPDAGLRAPGQRRRRPGPRPPEPLLIL